MERTMEHFRLNKLNEDDIDMVVAAAGGCRAVPDHSIEKRLNADYLLGDAVLELKLFEEEGLEKQTRREKLARLFKANQPGRPVVVLDPMLLGESERRSYYNILEGPIKTQVKKAAKQLDSTAKTQVEPCLRVLLAVNNGYTALSHQEFAERVVKCATNDTSRIDVVVAAGCYYYSDTFDYFLLAPIESVPIKNSVQFRSFEKLRKEWNELIEDKLVASIRGDEVVNNLKTPVLDLVYEADGIKFVKPSPPIGGPSSFFPNGRPRNDSTGLRRCPPVALTFPKLTPEEWRQFKTAIPDERALKQDYAAWQDFSRQEEVKPRDPKQPFVSIAITYERFDGWCCKAGARRDFGSICQFACDVFETELREIVKSSRSISERGILVPRFVFLKTEEIGQDKALDLCSIYKRSEIPGLERDELIVVNLNISFEHGKALAAAYAIKHGLSAVRFEIDKTYSWF